MSLRDKISEYIKDFFPDDVNNIRLADGLDGAFIGVGCSKCGKPVAIYDVDLCVRETMRNMKVRGQKGRDMAEEFLEYNTYDAYVGPYTPIFVRRFREKEWK